MAPAPSERLARECQQLRRDDEAGQRWSAKNYPGGFTSYNSASRMHQLSPTFATLDRKLNQHVARFARALELDLEGRALAATDCWVNIMPRQVVHRLHLHPLATISGTCHVKTPKGASGPEVRRPPPGALHGGAAAARAVNARPPDQVRGSSFRPRPGTWCCSRAGCATRFRRILRQPSESASVSITTGSSTLQERCHEETANMQSSRPSPEDPWAS